MPTISYNKEGGVIRWSAADWAAGLIPNWNIDYPSQIGNGGFSFAFGIDPFRKPGYAMPGVNIAASTNGSTVDAIATNAVVNSTKAYIVGGTKLHEYTILTNTVTNAGAFPRTITAHGGHTISEAQDVEVYYIGTTKYLFYSWKDNVDGDIGRFDLSATFDDDYMSTVAASGAVLDTTNPHPLIVGGDDILYIGDGNKLHGFDGQTGANGTLSKGALTLPKDYIITSYSKAKNFLVVYAYKSRGTSGSSFNRGESTAFFWDYVSEDPTYAYELQGNTVNGGFTLNETPGCFILGRNPVFGGLNNSKMLLFDGGKFVPVAVFPEAIPGKGGVEVSEGVVTFNAAGSVYQFGTPFPGAPTSFNRISYTGTSTGSGLLKSLDNNSFVISSSALLSKSGSTFYPGEFYTPIVDLDLPFTNGFTPTMVRVNWYTAGSTTNNLFRVDLRLRYNSGRSQQQVIIPTAATDFAISSTQDNYMSTFEKDVDNKGFYRMNSIGLYCKYDLIDSTETPPIIRSVDVHFRFEKN